MWKLKSLICAVVGFPKSQTSELEKDRERIAREMADGRILFIYRQKLFIFTSLYFRAES